MNFSDSTFETLAQYERYFRTAVDSDWCPNPGRTALGVMQDALDAIDRRTTPVNYNCGTCVLRVVKRAGYLYFADKAEREAAAAEQRSIAPELTAARVRAEAKTPVKKTTAKKTTKK